jgi:rhomboid protease GluP
MTDLFVVVHRAFGQPECREYALVLQSMNIEYEVQQGVVGWRVLVPEYEATRAREQWLRYKRENSNRAPRHIEAEPRAGALVGALVWAFVLMLCFSLQSNYGFGLDWTQAGHVNVAAVRGGEWWRTITALTLHADIAHLVVNVGFGAIFGSLLAREIGAGYAWALVLLGGMAGNMMNVAVQRPTHLSLGASTAVFAALGLLAAYIWTARRMLRHNWASRLSPVVGGVILLAWLGTGTERTDIVAHLTGFIAGFALGALLGRLPKRPGKNSQYQWVAAGAALLLIVFAWALALQSVGYTPRPM